MRDAKGPYERIGYWRIGGARKGEWGGGLGGDIG